LINVLHSKRPFFTWTYDQKRPKQRRSLVKARAQDKKARKRYCPPFLATCPKHLWVWHLARPNPCRLDYVLGPHTCGFGKPKHLWVLHIARFNPFRLDYTLGPNTYGFDTLPYSIFLGSDTCWALTSMRSSTSINPTSFELGLSSGTSAWSENLGSSSLYFQAGQKVL